MPYGIYYFIKNLILIGWVRGNTFTNETRKPIFRIKQNKLIIARWKAELRKNASNR